MFSVDDPYDYLDEEGRPVRVVPGIDGGKADGRNNRALAFIGGRRGETA